MPARWTPLLVASLSFAYLVSYPLAIGRADESHLLHEAMRVYDGQVPYADFFESLTPLGLYLFAGVYWLGGPSLLAARIAMAGIAALGCALLFVSVRRVAGTPEAWLATLIVVVLCLPVWPFASLHWVSTTLGLATAAVLLADRWQGSARARPLAAGLLAGAAFCVQQQRGAFLGLWLALALAWLALAAPRGARWAALRTTMTWGLGGAAAVVLVVLGHAAWRASLSGMLEMTFGFALKHYGPTHSGRTAWAEVLPLTQMHARPTWLWLLRVAPLFLLLEAAWLLATRGAHAWRDRQRVALCLLALLMAASVWYLPDFIHVAFVMPYLLIPAATVVFRLRTLAVWTRWPLGRHAVAAGLAVLAAVLLARGATNRAAAFAAAPVAWQTAFGPIRGTAGMQRLFEAIAQRLQPEADGRARLYLYPNDAWLFLTLPAENVTPFSSLVPVMFPASDFDTAVRIIAARSAGTAAVFAPVMVGEEGGRIRAALEAHYVLDAEVENYRIYVRRAEGAP